MKESSMYELANGLLAAWNSQDVDQVLARYTEDVVYVDPNTHGEVKGAGKAFSVEDIKKRLA